ncbi:hypothetical protein T10_4696 [Trichinella papuae]|uniref:Uncharacterized protein n=1 Tax=Trichinella papuae TaxID=268474 RepID=A0A0V1N9G1_9BILA|nr:hypothetical protein T10_4696 [Trichinella papuae]
MNKEPAVTADEKQSLAMTSPIEMSERDSILSSSRCEIISETEIEQNKELLKTIIGNVYCIYIGNNQIYYSRPRNTYINDSIKKEFNARINNDGQEERVAWLRAPFAEWVLYRKAKKEEKFNIGHRPIYENFMFQKEGFKGIPLKVLQDLIKKNPNVIIIIEKITLKLTAMENAVHQRECVHELFRYLDEINDGFMYRTSDGVTFQRIKENNPRETFLIEAPKNFITNLAFDAAKNCYKLGFIEKSRNNSSTTEKYSQGEIIFHLIFEALEEGYFNIIALEELK